eukprot:185480-Chlamydomonas_euryale.AAC.1
MGWSSNERGAGVAQHSRIGNQVHAVHATTVVQASEEVGLFRGTGARSNQSTLVVCRSLALHNRVRSTPCFPFGRTWSAALLQ